MEHPLVSIGLPVYNGVHRMRVAIDSLLAQTYRHFELIISDDGSTDETAQVCREYAARDTRVRSIRQEKNKGHLENIYFVLHAAQGEFFMLAADDDRWHEEFIENALAALIRHPHHGVAMSSFERTDEKGERIAIASYTGDLDLTERGYLAVATKMMSRHPVHIFLYGLFRIEFLRGLFSRPAPEVVAWDRVVMTEVALATHFASIPSVRFFKYSHRVPVKKRYKDQAVGAAYHATRPYANYVGAMLTRVFTSPIIPWYRKPLIIIPWLWLVWRYRGPLRFELWGRRRMSASAR